MARRPDDLQDRIHKAREDLVRFQEYAVRMGRMLAQLTQAGTDVGNPLHEDAPKLAGIVAGHVEDWAETIARQEEEIAELERRLAAP